MEKGKLTGSPLPVATVGVGFSYRRQDHSIECSECKASTDLSIEELVTLIHDESCSKFGQQLTEIIGLAGQDNPSSADQDNPSSADQDNHSSAVVVSLFESTNQDRQHVQDGLETVNNFNENQRRFVDDSRQQSRSEAFIEQVDANETFYQTVSEPVNETIHQTRLEASIEPAYTNQTHKTITGPGSIPSSNFYDTRHQTTSEASMGSANANGTTHQIISKPGKGPASANETPRQTDSNPGSGPSNANETTHQTISEPGREPANANKISHQTISELAVPLPNNVMLDLSIYDTINKILRAPSRYCFCSKCKGCAFSSCPRLRNRDLFEFPVFTDKTLVLNMKRKTESAPIHPIFANENARIQSFEQGETTSGNTSLQAEAGFFRNDDTDICCFCCDLGLREELLSYDPWREHARWFPMCPFVLEKKTEKFVHDVIVETNLLKEYLRDQRRCLQISTSVVEEALSKNYPPALIQSTIQGFFFDYGGFPCREELLSVLEAKTLWRTDLRLRFSRTMPW